MTGFTVFVTNQYGAKVLFDSQGEIGRFRDSYNNVIQGADDGIKRRAGNALWYMILENDKDADKWIRSRYCE